MRLLLQLSAAHSFRRTHAAAVQTVAAVSYNSQPPALPATLLATLLPRYSSFHHSKPSWTQSPLSFHRAYSNDTHQLIPSHDLLPAVICFTPAEIQSGYSSIPFKLIHYLHEYTGLPWWASIPLTTFCMRAALLPFSLKQSQVVRSSWINWKRAREIVQAKYADAAARELGVLQYSIGRAQRSSETVRIFWKLRQAEDGAHPAWLIVNPIIQLTVTVMMTRTLRAMCFLGWPGFSSEGVLWFPDLTLPCLITDPLTLPMGYTGAILPATVTSMILTSIYLGFKAFGPEKADDSALVATWRRWGPPLMYGVTTYSGYMMLQLPHGALLHWFASCAFTLNMQTALQHPAARKLLGLAHTSPAVAADVPATPSMNMSTKPAEASKAPEVDAGVKVQAEEMTDTNALVALSAQLSARKQYPAARYCLEKATEMDPHNFRAHYSLAQVCVHLRDWGAAEASYRQVLHVAADLDKALKGQVMYCIGDSLSAQGKTQEAIEWYEKATELWTMPIVWFQLVKSYKKLGQMDKARAGLERALELDAQLGMKGLTPVLEAMRAELTDGQGESARSAEPAPAPAATVK